MKKALSKRTKGVSRYIRVLCTCAVKPAEPKARITRVDMAVTQTRFHADVLRPPALKSMFTIKTNNDLRFSENGVMKVIGASSDKTAIKTFQRWSVFGHPTVPSWKTSAHICMFGVFVFPAGSISYQE